MCSGRKPLIGILAWLSTAAVWIGCNSTEPPSGPIADARRPQQPRPVRRFDFKPHKDDALTGQNDAASQSVAFQFKDVAAEQGIRHTYRNGAQGQMLMIETLGGGCGWIDYDSDGLIDAYLAQGGKSGQSPGTQQATNRLYRNLNPGFTDVTDLAHVDDLEYSHGVAVGDYDNDGFDDVYVTAAGHNTLYHNLGDGTFVEVTDRSGTQDGRWSSSAAWADLDQDGDLDLYVCNYCKYDPLNPVMCLREDQSPGMCNPRGLDAF
ncbi:MAG: VCBS repeat-containing protein, partial [Planctomycetaceae bacterium]